MRAFVLVFSLQGSPALPPDGWLGADKVRHLFMSAFVQSVSYGSLRGAGVSHGAALAGATAATAAVSVGKELRDRRVTGVFSTRDLVWDAAGAGAMTVLLGKTAR
jgi:uncharacterized protein YfiM (DUF2279 family)